jgi:hypothetical protein
MVATISGMAETPVDLAPPEADGPTTQGTATPAAAATQSPSMPRATTQDAATPDAVTQSAAKPELATQSPVEIAAPYTERAWTDAARATLDELRHQVQAHRAELMVGAGAAVGIAAAGWLCASALTLAVWATAAPANGSVAMPLHVAGQLWLAAHHVMLHTPDGPFGLSPLGFSILPVGALVLTGRQAARRHDAGAWSLGTVVVCYPLAALVIAWSAASDSLHAETGAAIGYPCLIAACGYGAGLLSHGVTRLDRWAIAAVRAGTGALAVLVAGAALLAAVALVLRSADVTRVGEQIGQGAAGGAGLFLIDLALTPNVVVWALGFVTGPGFAVGDDSSVRLTGVVHGPLPGLPVLQGVPPAGHLPAVMWLVLAVPVGAGVAALLLVWRSVRSAAERAAALGVAAPAVGAVAGAAAVLSGGPVAAGATSDVGPVPWQVALAVLAELSVIAAAGFGLWYAVDHGRGLLAAPGRDDSADTEEMPVLRLDDDRLGDLVAPGLVLGVPERPEVVEQAGDEAEDEEQPVEEQAQEAEPAADGHAVGESGEPDADGALAEGLPGAPGLDGVVDRPDEADQADDAESDVGPVAEVGAVEGTADDGEPVVEQEGGGPVPPPGEGGHADG